MTAHFLLICTIFNALIFPFAVFNVVLLHIPSIPLKPFLIVSESMEPVVPTGSIIYTVPKSQYQLGDVITFVASNQTITHRIVKKIIISGETYFSTKGDANNMADFDLVHESSIYGKISTIVPQVGQAILFYRTEAGTLAKILVTTVSVITVVILWGSRLKYNFHTIGGK